MTGTTTWSGRPAVWWGAAAVLLALAWGATWGLVAFGQLAIFAMLLVSAAALVVAWTCLERDLVHMGVAGAVVGYAAWPVAGGMFSVLGGVLAGVLVGDAIRDGRSDLLLRRAPSSEARWWRRGLVEPAWPRWTAWSLALAAALLVLPVAIVGAVISVPVGQRRAMLDQVYQRCLDVELRVPSLVTLASESLLRVWYVYALLLVGAVACWRVRQTPSGDEGRDRQLRRIAVTHCLAWFLLSGGAVLTLRAALADAAGAAGAGEPQALLTPVCAALVSTTRDAQIPLALMLLTLLFLGRHLGRYLWRHGWMVALAVVGAVAVGLDFVQTLYIVQRCG